MSALSLTFGLMEPSIQLLLLLLVWLQPAITVADVTDTTDSVANTIHSITWDRCKKLDNKYQPVMINPIDTAATRLDLSRCNLTEIRQSDFHGLPNLEILFVYINDLTELESSTFKSVPKLDQLYLDRNKLRELPVFDEQSLNQLTILHLDDNLLTGIYDPKTFSACAKLKSLQMSNNKIEYLHPNIFKPLRELYYLDLSRNRITSMSESIFASNLKLTWLWLRNNNIAQLPANIISPLANNAGSFRMFAFYNNPWHCECLLELVADVSHVGLRYHKFDASKGRRVVTHYDGTRPECVFSGFISAPQIKYKVPRKMHCMREHTTFPYSV